MTAILLTMRRIRSMTNQRTAETIAAVPYAVIDRNQCRTNRRIYTYSAVDLKLRHTLNINQTKPNLSWCDSGLVLTTTPWQHPNDLFCGDAVLNVLSVEELVDCTCMSAICRVTCVSVGRSVLANFFAP